LIYGCKNNKLKEEMFAGRLGGLEAWRLGGGKAKAEGLGN